MVKDKAAERVHDAAVAADDDVVSGIVMVKKASEEALEYIDMLMKNYNDRDYKLMVVSKYARNIGVAQAIADTVIPVRKDMQKRFHKKVGLDKMSAEVFSDVFMARVIDNLVKELN